MLLRITEFFCFSNLQKKTFDVVKQKNPDITCRDFFCAPERISDLTAKVHSKHEISCCFASLNFFVSPTYKRKLLTLLNKKIPTLYVEISFVTPKGFEPLTFALEGRCSIQLSYGAIIFYFNRTRCAILPTFRESYGAIIF